MFFIFLGLALFILLFIIWLSAQGGKRDHPLWRALLAAGIKPKESDRLLCQQCSFTAKPQLMTAREYTFFSALSPATGAHHWYFCPQVRVADIVEVSSAWKKAAVNGGVYSGLFHSGIVMSWLLSEKQVALLRRLNWMMQRINK
ncbi:hypothetical protein MQ086_19540 (plasmid) [Edwardsiella anguillarum]|uniref:hypothetical protein n=1 Tax=Edwardsiella anguillarum TaxID=1821960 RepID=UPI0024B7B809|nr:hypothetical protein [Edwardsiella anguillarum]WHQ04891.1 hypothetical protein MQ086_19540 [Edwardsiella anguillarum]